MLRPDTGTRLAGVVYTASESVSGGAKDASRHAQPHQSARARRPVTHPADRRVALFVSCLVDLFRPSVGFAAIKLLRDAGCEVQVPRAQTCCGQPAFNSGDRASAIALAQSVIATFEDFDHVVVPSGSCAGMMIRDYPELLSADAGWFARAQALAERTHELTAYLVDILGVTSVAARADATATYHDSCSSLRALGIKRQPRTLLESIPGLKLTPLPDSETCCGFGGTFCVKYPDISNQMVAAKAAGVEATGADLLLSGDLGCLLNIAGKLRRNGSAVEIRHVAEVLADAMDTPSIGGEGTP